MKTLVHTLAADGKELPVIVEALRRAYEDGVRQETEGARLDPPARARVVRGIHSAALAVLDRVFQL